MAKYLFQVHPEVTAQDLPCLPVELRKLFQASIRQQLITAPISNPKFATHILSGDLANHRALEVEWERDPNAYRLVYRVCNRPAPRRVEVFSFAKHDAAYDKAKNRTGEKR